MSRPKIGPEGSSHFFLPRLVIVVGYMTPLTGKYRANLPGMLFKSLSPEFFGNSLFS